MKNLILEVRFFQTEMEKAPVREWLREMVALDRKVIGQDLKAVQLEWPLGMPLVQKMEANMWEVRISLKDRIARVLFTILGNTMILVHGFIKKSQTTPKDDVELARKRIRQLRSII